jgi:hypothetical protein
VDGIESLCLWFSKGRELGRARRHRCAGEHAARIAEDRFLVVVEQKRVLSVGWIAAVASWCEWDGQSSFAKSWMIETMQELSTGLPHHLRCSLTKDQEEI